jgi:hypothetical protein
MEHARAESRSQGYPPAVRDSNEDLSHQTEEAGRSSRRCLDRPPPRAALLPADCGTTRPHSLKPLSLASLPPCPSSAGL